MANLKNSKSQSMGLHKEVLKGRTQQVFFNPEEAENLREKYLETLRITDDYGAKGLTAAETSIIDTLYAELAGDVAAVALQNRNLANDARNMQQRERTGALTR